MPKKNLIKKQFKQNINLGFALASFALAIYLGWSFELALALALLVYSLLNDFSPDFYKRAAIISAVVSALALAINNQSISEKLGVISFVSLIIYLIFQFFITRKNDS